MKTKVILILAALAIIALAAVASAAADAKEYKGDIIDTMCLNGHKANLKDFVATHTKDCVLAPHCKDSGMNLYQSDGTILKFDPESNKKIVTFLTTKDAKLQVVVKADKNADGTYKLLSIANQ